MVNIGLSDKYWKKHINVSADPAYVEEENKRLKRQAECKHEITMTFRKFDRWSTKCEQCSLILGSDATETPEKIMFGDTL